MIDFMCYMLAGIIVGIFVGLILFSIYPMAKRTAWLDFPLEYESSILDIYRVLPVKDFSILTPSVSMNDDESFTFNGGRIRLLVRLPLLYGFQLSDFSPHRYLNFLIEKAEQQDIIPLSSGLY